MTNDATIEKIVEILTDNPDQILYYRGKLMGWLRPLDKAGREADRAFYLEAWNGKGSFSVDRIGRGSLHVPAVCVSVLGFDLQGLRFALVLRGKVSACPALRRMGERGVGAPPPPPCGYQSTDPP